MLHAIENEFLTVKVSERGAELMSVVGKQSNFEYLWQGNAEFWASRASVLFPICGRLTNGGYTWKGQFYEMPIHGIARHSTFTLIENTGSSITMELSDSPETRKAYPFAFRFRMTYTLVGNSLVNRFEVFNDSEEDLPFSVGGHPGFHVPLTEGESFEDCYLEFACTKDAKRLVMSPTCYYLNEKAPYPLVDGRILPLRHDLFDDDAIFLADCCKTVSIKSKKSARALTVSYKDFPYVGFWHKPHAAAPYVCIEPWCGVPALDGKVDDLATKLEMTHLGKGEHYQNEFTVTVTE